MLLSLKNIGKSFGAEKIFSEITADIDKKDRIGIIGENGAGKTTLLRVLTGELQADEGEFNLANNTTIGYLKQNADLNSELTVYQEMQTAFADVHLAQKEIVEIEKLLVFEPENHQLIEKHSQMLSVIDAKDGYNMDSQIKKVLNGMSFLEDTWQKGVAVLSGGERTRLSLSKMLLQQPDILILDEPTNHLDFETLQWLENYLNNYRSSMIIVSHDRYFLDAVANHIWEVENQAMVCYKGNYSSFLPQKEQAIELQQKKHDADVEKAKKLQDYVDKNLVRASTTKMAQSRRKQLEKMEITEKPNVSHTKIKMDFEYDTEPYTEVLTIKNLSVSAGNNTLISNLDYQVLRGDRLIIAGSNGTGKSTLLKVLSGRLRAAQGVVRTGSGVKLSYFEQQQEKRVGTAINAIWDKYPRLKELEIRSLLARFGFRGEDVFKQANLLSGGELARLRLAEIYLERSNLLFLDEPTNHLDIYTRQIISEALLRYKGTLVIVTHDRYLMNSFACPILYVDIDKVSTFKNYQDMMQSFGSKQPVVQIQQQAQTEKPLQNLKELRRKKAEIRTSLKNIEIEIEGNGATVVELENMLTDPQVVSDHIKLREICDDLDDAKALQNDLYQKWEHLLEQAEIFETE